MYVQKVTTPFLQEKFNQIWETCWKEKGYELEYSKHANQFIFGAGKGCVELKQFRHEIDDFFKTSKDNDIKNFRFSKLEEIKHCLDKTFEIDKLSILKENRGKRILDDILLFLGDFALENNVKYYIALLEPKLFLSLKIFYHLPIKKVGKTFHYKGDKVVPIVFNVEKANQERHKYNWAKKPITIH